jgi:hypothetical protein
MSYLVQISTSSYRDQTNYIVEVDKRPSNRKLRKDTLRALVLTDVDGDQIAVPWSNIVVVKVVPA